MAAKSKHELGLRLIAIGKLLKAVTLVSIGVGALALAGHGPTRGLTELVSAIGIHPGSRHLHWVVAKVSGVSVKHLEEAGFGSFVYALVFATEGFGLWMKKRWAEYLTTAVTISFIPFEIYEIARHITVARVAMLILNVIVVVYLVARISWERRQPAPARLGTASR